jgi:hypothetical protein
MAHVHAGIVQHQVADIDELAHRAEKWTRFSEFFKGKPDSDQEQRLPFWFLSIRLFRLHHPGGNNGNRQND